MNATVVEALSIQRPGTVYRLGRRIPGLGAVGGQIESFGRYWRSLALESLESDRTALVAVGDSLAQGIGASSPENSYVGLMRSELSRHSPEPVSVLNLSRSGARIDDVVDVQLPALNASGVTPRMVLCTVGSNDLLRSPRIGATKRRLRRLLDTLPPGAMVATIPDIGSLAAKSFNRELVNQAHDRGIPVADVAAALVSWRGRQAADRFHPNDDGYRIWFRAFTETASTA